MEQELKVHYFQSARKADLRNKAGAFVEKDC